MLFVAKELRRSIKGRPLYAHVSFELVQGQTLVVQGESGAGKSQLLRQLSGLDGAGSNSEDSAGSIQYKGICMSTWSPFEWRTEVSLVPQHTPRLEGSPDEFAQRLKQLKMQRCRSGENPIELATFFGLRPAQWQCPWADLSIGERHRAMLAILMARRPGVLLLDEPSAALDEESTRRLEEILKERTCVWVTHSSEQAERVADKTLYIKKVEHAD